MTSSERNDPAHHHHHGMRNGHHRSGDGGDDEHDIFNDHTPPESQDDGRSRSHDENYHYNPVENMTNNSTIPTQTQVSATGNSSYGGGTRGSG